MKKLSKTDWVSLQSFKEKQYNIPPNTFKWLVSAHNLTETLKKTGVKFSLNLLHQSFEQPYSEEVGAFKNYNSEASYSLVRQVFLEGNNKPLVFARVIVPEQTYLNYCDEFSNLGSLAIGNTILYADKKIKRQAFEFKLIKNGNQAFEELKKLNQIDNEENCYWARRSIFILPKGPLLISEIFLNMPNYPLI